MSDGAPERLDVHDTVGAAPELEFIVDESVRRAFVGVAASRVRLRISIESVTPSLNNEKPMMFEDGFEEAVNSFLVERTPAHAHLESGDAALALQVELLERFRVRMGDKAISIFMNRVWTPERAAVHGPAANPKTLRRWRADLRRRQTV